MHGSAPEVAFFHPNAKKAEADALLKGRPDGTYLLRPYNNGSVLSVVFRQTPTHHLVFKSPASGKMVVNKQETTVTTLGDVVRLLATTHPWWPVALERGVPCPASTAAPTASMPAPPTPAKPKTVAEEAMLLPQFHQTATKAQAERT